MVGEDHTDDACLEHKGQKLVRRAMVLQLIVFPWFIPLCTFVPRRRLQAMKLSPLIKTQCYHLTQENVFIPILFQGHFSIE